MSWHITGWSLVELAEGLLAIFGLLMLLIVIAASIMHKRQSEIDAHRCDNDVL